MKTFLVPALAFTLVLFLPAISSAQNNGLQSGQDFLTAMDANDLAGLTSAVSKDFKIVHPNFPAPLSLQEFFEMQVKPFNAAFQGLVHTALDGSAGGNKLAMRGIVTGKHTGELMGIPASNNEISVPWLAFATLDDEGKIMELHVQFNQLSFLAQIGANPLAKN
jgi:predicted ester cyclase